MTTLPTRSIRAICACALLLSACKKASSENPLGGKVALSLHSNGVSPDDSEAPDICATFTLTPYSLDANGNETAAGASTTISGTGPSASPILGCVHTPGVAPDWRYIVTATNFAGCTTEVDGISPATETFLVDVDCTPGLDVSASVTANVSVPVANGAGYIDIGVGVNASTPQSGCKQADIDSSGALHFGQSYVSTPGGPTPSAYTGIGIFTPGTPPASSESGTAPDPGTLQQFEGIVQSGSAVDAYFTGLLQLPASGQTATIVQAFAQPCPSGEMTIQPSAVECVTQATLPDTTSTAVQIADVFVEWPGRASVSASITDAQTVNLDTSLGGPNLASVAPATEGSDVLSNTQTLSISDVAIGLYGSLAHADELLLLVQDATLGPSLEVLTLDESSGLWSAALPVALSTMSTAQQQALGLFGSGGCFPAASPSEIAPADLAYGESELDCIAGEECDLDGPTSDGGAVTSYSISPDLPDGLTFDPTTGAISGAATAESDVAVYTVTATNSAGSTTTTISISVGPAAPSNLAYTVTQLNCIVGVPCPLAAPTNSGGAPGSYSISGTMPAGMTFNTGSGEISGTPTAVVANTAHTVTATNPTGSTTEQIHIHVSAATLTYSPHTIACATGIPCSIAAPTDTGGAPFSCSITTPVAGLPNGLSINSNCAISGTPTAASASTTYTATAHNLVGTAAGTVIISISAAALTYNPNQVICDVGIACSLAAPTDNTGPISSCSIAPALPSGLNFNTSTCAISGTAAANSPLTSYTVTANTSGATLNASINVTVFTAAQTVGNMINGRARHTATLLNDGHVLIVGGDGASGPLASAELFDPGTNTFSATGSLNEARTDHSATLLPDGRVLISGGSNPSNQFLPSNEIYDPSTSAFTETTPLQAGRDTHAAILLPNGSVLIVGGLGSVIPGQDNDLASAELYDPATGHVTYTGSLHTARGDFPTATILPSGLVLIAGGHSPQVDEDLEPPPPAELYDPSAGTFTETGFMQVDRFYSSATLLANGQVLLTAGSTALLDTPIATCELYNPGTGLFSFTGSLAYAQTFYGATVTVAGGLVLAAPGIDPALPGAQRQFQLYDPSAGTWSDGPLAYTPRALNTTTLLQNGHVLVTGGNAYDFVTGVLIDSANTAEVY